jgi:hypothetical protein
MATFPTLHLNGTGKNDLRDGYANAYDAIDKAIEALANAELNGRDFYPQGPGAYHRPAASAMLLLLSFARLTNTWAKCSWASATKCHEHPQSLPQQRKASQAEA